MWDASVALLAVAAVVAACLLVGTGTPRPMQCAVANLPATCWGGD
jgi:hypothetical protein